MSLFHTLNRAVRIVGFLALALATWWIYQQRAWFSPIGDAYRALKVTGELQHTLGGEMSGVGIEALQGDGFKFRDTNAVIRTVRLTGLIVPAQGPFTPDRLAAIQKQSRVTLNELIVSNHVRVQVTYTASPVSLLGFARVDGTNLNLLLLEHGLAQAIPGGMHGLPFGVRWGLFRAETRARQQGLGLWAAADKMALAPAPNPR